MATTTTNFGWDIPQSTDLVKDGATAIAALGQDIDTAFIDLKGGTTGQVLSKASNTDLDFTWATDASGIPATIFDAKGDLIAASAADTAARLAVGTNGYILTADSSTATGLKWAAPAGGGKVLQVVSTHWTTSFSTTSSSYVDVTNASLNITPSSTSSRILFIGSWYARGQGSNDQNGGDLQLLRNSTSIDEPGFVYHLLGGNGQPFATQAAIGAHIVDSPATTSSTTYKIQIKQYNGTAYLERGGVITLMEIGA